MSSGSPVVIPEVVYTIIAAIVAACIAHIGIRHSLRAHAERERVQREIDMRREVFFSAAEAVSQADTFIRRFGDSTLSDAEHRNW